MASVPASKHNFSHAYRDKIILAPMVRMGMLPFRLLCLRYGADLVCSEEIIDVKLLRCKRIENSEAATVDFVDSDGTVVFQTCAEERQHVILQLGTADARRALAAAKLVEHDVFGIDVNMGCPKDFSLKGGMGAALLRTPQLAHDILLNLVSNLSIPVTCKIRLLAEAADETLTFATLVASTGIAAIAVHGRLVSERPRDKNHNEAIAQLADRLPIPVICNGGSSEITSRDDMLAFRDETRASSVMLARCVQRNPSLFRKAGVLSRAQMVSDFVCLAARYNLCHTVCKYTLQNMYGDVSADDAGQKLLAARSLEEICSAFGKHDEYRECMKLYWPNSANTICNSDSLLRCDAPRPSKRPLVDAADGDNNHYPVYEMPFKYFCKSLKSPQLPRVRLFMWTLRNKLDPPLYSVKNEGNLFFAEVIVEKKTFTSTIGHKNKKQADQAAAFVALTFFNVNKTDEDDSDADTIGLKAADAANG